MTEESGRPGTCKSKVGCEAMDEPCTNRMVPMLLPGSPAHFANRNSFTPPSLLVQCSAPLIATGLLISFIAHPFFLAHDLIRPSFARRSGFAKAGNRFPLFGIMR
ncbi:MAG: hypothetical protein ACHP82_08205 [Hyphomicrobiales bacterium]